MSVPADSASYYMLFDLGLGTST